MSGNAMLTIVTSRNAMKTATDVTSSTFQRCLTKRTLAHALRDATNVARLTGGGCFEKKKKKKKTKPCSPTPMTTRCAPSPAPSSYIGDRWTLLIIRDAFLRGPPLRRLPARPRRRPQRPARAASSRLVEGGPPRAPPLPGAPRALRVPVDGEGPRPLAGGRHADEVGRPHYGRPRVRPRSSSTAGAAARSRAS